MGMLSGIPLPIAAGYMDDYAIFFYSALSLFVIAFFVWRARAGMKERVFKNSFTQLAEQLYLFIENIAVGVIGPRGPKFIPFLMAIWLYIFVSNIVGLIAPHTVTANWGANVGLAVFVVLYANWQGIKAHGLVGHFRHFLGPKIGGEGGAFERVAMGLLGVVIAMLLLLIELIGEIIKMLSLSLRLYGNISGGHTAKLTLDEFAVGLGGLILPLEFLVSIIQALVFTLLTAVYLGLLAGGDDHSHDDHHEPHEEDRTPVGSVQVPA